MRSVKMIMIKILSIFWLLFFSHTASSQSCTKKEEMNHCKNSQSVCDDRSENDSRNECKLMNNHQVERKIIRVDYDGFSLWLDCQRHGAIQFQYNAQHDIGNASRAKTFSLDPKVPTHCQQINAKAYGHHYDRGHLVPANHLDASMTTIKATNNITNILPQAANMNRGAWLVTEEITECYRDISELLVIGGVIWGNDPTDDFFVKSHGIKTPDAFWKVIVRGGLEDEQSIAWIIPNSQAATRHKIDDYLVTVHDIETLTGQKIPVTEDLKDKKPSSSWGIPIGCNKG
jgi:endonuclease G